ncbi:hypothetical protein FA95DRAFT_1578387, partial [Auriscalpium vulgare]
MAHYLETLLTRIQLELDGFKADWPHQRKVKWCRTMVQLLEEGSAENEGGSHATFNDYITKFLNVAFAHGTPEWETISKGMFTLQVGPSKQLVQCLTNTAQHIAPGPVRDRSGVPSPGAGPHRTLRVLRVQGQSDVDAVPARHDRIITRQAVVDDDEQNARPRTTGTATPPTLPGPRAEDDEKALAARQEFTPVGRQKRKSVENADTADDGANRVPSSRNKRPRRAPKKAAKHDDLDTLPCEITLTSHPKDLVACKFCRVSKQKCRFDGAPDKKPWREERRGSGTPRRAEREAAAEPMHLLDNDSRATQYAEKPRAPAPLVGAGGIPPDAQMSNAVEENRTLLQERANEAAGDDILQEKAEGKKRDKGKRKAIVETPPSSVEDAVPLFDEFIESAIAKEDDESEAGTQDLSTYDAGLADARLLLPRAFTSRDAADASRLPGTATLSQAT